MKFCLIRDVDIRNILGKTSMLYYEKYKKMIKIAKAESVFVDIACLEFNRNEHIQEASISI
jgi:hypothetical protein